MKSVADRKNPKIGTTPVWRPVSSQASSSEVDKQVGEVQDVMFNSVSENEGAHVEDRAVNEVAAFECTSSSGLKKDDGSELLAEELVPSEQKHSIRIEAAAPLIIFIKEKESSTRKKIEEEMGVQIIFPLGKKDEYISRWLTTSTHGFYDLLAVTLSICLLLHEMDLGPQSLSYPFFKLDINRLIKMTLNDEEKEIHIDDLLASLKGID